MVQYPQGMAKAKTKKVIRKRREKVIRTSVLEASVLGVAPEQLLGRAAEPPVNLPVVPVVTANLPVTPMHRIHPLHRPLVSGRTSFWLGVGFGIFVTGVLAYLAWRLYSVEIAEAIVLGLGV